MSKNEMSRRQAIKEIAAVNQKVKEGYPIFVSPGNTKEISAVRAAAIKLKCDGWGLSKRVGSPTRPGSWMRQFDIEPNWQLKTPKQQAEEKQQEEFEPFVLEHETPPIGAVDGQRWSLTSDKNNIFKFAAFGDLHAASRYSRADVREDLTRRAEKFGAQCIFDTGNWIDGEARFNRYDIEVAGLDGQCKLLAKVYPKTKLPTYAVTGKDHEGWYGGIDVGRYCESIMRDAGHKWTNLGYMQADILLVNANTKRTNILRVMHPGGGTGYALSYRPQKIIESMEGGEKPAVLLLGHYHKLDAGLVRNVFYAQTGCGQDQTPFMAQKAIEAHIGGVLIEIEQDPATGAIVSYKPELRRYFNRKYYFDQGRANNRWSGHGPITQIPRRSNQD